MPGSSKISKIRSWMPTFDLTTIITIWMIDINCLECLSDNNFMTSPIVSFLYIAKINEAIVSSLGSKRFTNRKVFEFLLLSWKIYFENWVFGQRIGRFVYDKIYLIYNKFLRARCVLKIGLEFNLPHYCWPKSFRGNFEKCSSIEFEKEN